MADDLTRVREARYLLLTTFRTDGTPVPTPVWAADVGQELLVWTERKTGKVKRIRRDGRVTVAPCSFTGRPRGNTVEARARLLADEGIERTRSAIERKYGWLARVLTRGAERLNGPGSVIGIAVTLPAADATDAAA
jgi:PPOX class probable F420-dependent enzyme